MARNPFVLLALCAMAGIWLADSIPLPVAIGLSIALALALAACLLRRNVLTAIAVLALFHCLHSVQILNCPGLLLAQNLPTDSRVVVTASGVIVDTPKLSAQNRETRPSWTFTLRLEQIATDTHSFTGPALVRVRWIGQEPHYGDRVSLSATASHISPARNPGEYDMKMHLRRKGIGVELRVRSAQDGVITAPDQGNPIIALAGNLRDTIDARLRKNLEDSPDVAAVISGMVLGVDVDTPEEVRELFRNTGTMHLFAVSGLHVAMFALLVWTLIRPFSPPRRAAILFVLPLLLLYAAITGFRPSVLRATVMTAIVLGGTAFERRPVLLNNLAAAAFFLLAFDPNQLFDLGFQLSFSVVFSIVLFADLLRRPFLNIGNPDPFLPTPLLNPFQRIFRSSGRWLAGSLGVSLAAWFGSMPMGLSVFHLFTPIAIFSNLIVVPLAFAVLSLGLLSILSAIFSSGISILFNNANWVVAKLILLCVQFFSTVPYGHFYLGKPDFHPPLARLTVFDLGAGGSVLLESDGHHWLLDSGSGADANRVIIPRLRELGLDQLDGLFLTHGDVHHLGGAASVLDATAPREIFTSTLEDRSTHREQLLKQLASQSKGRSLLRAGDAFPLADNVTLRVLFPPADIARRLSDDKALVLQLRIGKWSVLLTSDSGFPTEQWLVQNTVDLPSTILIKGNHASDLSGTQDFLARVAPQLLVTTAARFPASESPTPEWEQMVETLGIRLMRQDRTGAVTLEFRQDAWTATPFLPPK